MIGVGDGVTTGFGVGVGVGVGGKLFVMTTIFDGVGVAPTIRTLVGVGEGFTSCEKLVEAVINIAQINIKLLFIKQSPEVKTVSDKLFAVSGCTSQTLANLRF